MDDIVRLRAAAQGGSVVAQGFLGLMYLFGDEGLAEDHAEAFRWLSAAAERGAARPSVWLGHMFEAGLGVPPDLTRAEALYRFAAERGEVYGCIFLARLHATGKLGAADDVLALRWYRKAVELCPRDSADDDDDIEEARRFVRQRSSRR